MTGEDRRNGRIWQAEVAAATYMELHILFDQVAPSIVQHIFGDVKPMHGIEGLAEMLCNAARAAANLNAAIVLQAVITPSSVEIVPIGFSKGVKLIIGPWRSAVFVFVRAGC